MDSRIFAIGDVHGCFENLRTMVEDVIQPQPKDKIVLLGDYIDRGNSSKEVVDYVVDLKNKGLDLITLTGNHEIMLLNAYQNSGHLFNWLLNGGLKTLESFGINSLQELDKQYLDFFKSLPYYYEHESFLFVHAGFNDDVKDPFSDKYSMIWSYGKRYNHPVLKNRIIVHGHNPITLETCRRELKVNRKVINIDTGCVYSEESGYGKLTAIELNSMVLYSV